MKLLIDMNLAPAWCGALGRYGFTATHWSAVGDPRATDKTIMAYAQVGGFVVLTHDLDFGILLALTHAGGPSVIQARTRDIAPGQLAPRVAALIKQHAAELKAGALITLDDLRSRVRVLPLHR